MLNKVFEKLPKFVSHIYVVIAILISFVIFSGNGLSGAMADLGAMFGAGGISFWSSETAYYLGSYGVVLLAAILGSTPLVKTAVLKIKEKKAGALVCDGRLPPVPP